MAILASCLFIVFAPINANKLQQTEHKHKPGQFGGFIMELGKDNYHLEVSLGKDGVITIYTLGKDETRVISVEKQVITAYLKDDKFDLMPSPQAGDEDKTSRFIGKLPAKYLSEGEISIIFNIVIEGQRFRARILITQLPQTDLSSAEEKKLYLTPGGLYTEQDIIANGKTSASNKFKDFVPSHDLKPKKGDRICPITLTKANPKCTWIINGKEYWFCCPPCIEEFLILAKEKPEQVKLPEEYIKGE
jgi:YHS domain-containing protein